VTAEAWHGKCSRREKTDASVVERMALAVSSAALGLRAVQQPARASRRQHVPEGWMADAWAGEYWKQELDENEHLDGGLAMTLAASRK
jgi:hypothetical protein